MAKIKNTKATDDEVLKPQEEIADAQNAEANASEATDDEAAVKSEGKEVTNEADIPDAVKKTLKVFANYAELAIDGHGGVYTDIKRVPAKEKAVLYKNPYYNK